MRVTVRDAAMLLSISEEQIYDWIESGDLPEPGSYVCDFTGVGDARRSKIRLLSSCLE